MQEQGRHVDIVVPIYNAVQMTRQCARSVLQHATGSFRLLLVDDASTEPAMRGVLSELAHDERVVVLRNTSNLGFVATANRGMKASTEGDVLLLNSDTEVFEGFLDRLRTAAHRDPATGIVSALSNNATILSVPEWLRDNRVPAPHDHRSFAALVARVSRREYPEIVTAVGFCMYLKREVLSAIGYFDEQTFGRGFGEENDLCERAKQAGFRVRVADDVFVWHKGKASFGDEGRVREAENLRLVERKHPGYLASVQRFIGENPLAPMQRRIRFGLDRERRLRSSSTLFLLHANPWAWTPGGTEFHVLDLVRSLRLPRALIAHPARGSLAVAEVFGGDLRSAARFSFPLKSPPERFCIENDEVGRVLREWIRLFDIGGAHVHHLLGWPISVLRILDEQRVPFVYSSHDYYAACPSVTLVDARGRPCEFDAGGRCKGSCASSLDIEIRNAEVFVRDHRAAFVDGLARAKAVVFPSERAREVLLGSLPLVRERTRVIAHGFDRVPPAAPREADGMLRAAILGEVAMPAKGRDAYLRAMRTTAGTRIAWHVFGSNREEGFREAAVRASGNSVVFHGRYERVEIGPRLQAAGIDVAVFLPAWHETYSYVLSEAVSAGIPAVVNEMGAPADRVRRYGYGIVVKSADEAGRALLRLAEDRAALADMARRTRDDPEPDLATMADDYRSLYQEAGLNADQASAAAWDEHVVAELADRFEESPSADAHGAVSVEPPRYQGSFWYPMFRRIKSVVPRRWREAGRAVLVRRQRPLVLRLDPRRGSQVERVVGAKLLRKSLLGATYAVEGPEARIVFAPRRLPVSTARVLRFWARHGLRSGPHARIYFRATPDEPFDDEQSIRVELHASPGDYREYIVRLDAPSLGGRFPVGGEVHQVQIGPLDAKGEIELGPLEFCA